MATKAKSADAENAAPEEPKQEEAPKQAESNTSTASDAKSSSKSPSKSRASKKGPATMEVEITATRVYHNGRFRVRGERLELTRPQIERVRGAVKPAKG